MESPLRGTGSGAREGPYHREHRDFSPKEKLSSKRREEDRQRETESVQPDQSSQHRKAELAAEANPGPRNGAQDSRKKRCRSPDHGPIREPRENGEKKESGRPEPAPATAKAKPESSRTQRTRRAGSCTGIARENKRTQAPENRRTRPRSPAGSVSSARRQNSLEPRLGLREHHPSASAQEPCDAPLSRLLTHLGALEAALEELRAPGGAFLPLQVPEPAGTPQPSASQRSWLAWHLVHAGYSLHWALNALDTLLASQPGANFPTES